MYIILTTYIAIQSFYLFWLTAIKITLKDGHGSVSSGIYKDENIQHFEVDIGATVTMTCSLFIQPAPFLFVMWHKADQIVSINAQLSQVYRKVVYIFYDITLGTGT